MDQRGRRIPEERIVELAFVEDPQGLGAPAP
jgi:hypothetical protein